MKKNATVYNNYLTNIIYGEDTQGPNNPSREKPHRMNAGQREKERSDRDRERGRERKEGDMIE